MAKKNREEVNTSQNRNRLLDTEDKPMGTRGEEGRGLGGEGAGMKKYKRVVTEQSRGVSTAQGIRSVIL